MSLNVKRKTAQRLGSNKTILKTMLLVTAVFLSASCQQDLYEDSEMGSHLKRTELSLTTSKQHQAVRVCATGETVRGMDVSKWVGEVNWQQVAQEDIGFAFIRVSDGLNFVDAQFDRNWAEAKANGIRRGAYQFFRAHLDPIAQANLLLEKMGPLQPGDLPPVIDVEATNGQSAAQIVANVRLWLDHVEAATGIQPIVYTGVYFWNDNVGSDAFADYPLWVPNYGVACPLVPDAWSNWTFWQDTDTGALNGVDGNTDLNFFNGNLQMLQALALPEPNDVPVDAGTGDELNDAGFSDAGTHNELDAGAFFTDSGTLTDSGIFADAGSENRFDAGQNDVADAGSFTNDADAGDESEQVDDENVLPPSVITRCTCAKTPSQSGPFALLILGLLGLHFRKDRRVHKNSQA